MEAEWLPLLGLVFDPKNDLVEVALDGVDHMIPKPREIYVDDGLRSPMSIEIVDAEGAKQIIKLRDPEHSPMGQFNSDIRRAFLWYMPKDERWYQIVKAMSIVAVIF